MCPGSRFWLGFFVSWLFCLVAGDLGVEGGEGYGEGLERADGVLKVHRELVLAHAPELRKKRSV